MGGRRRKRSSEEKVPESESESTRKGVLLYLMTGDQDGITVAWPRDIEGPLYPRGHFWWTFKDWVENNIRRKSLVIVRSIYFGFSMDMLAVKSIDSHERNLNRRITAWKFCVRLKRREGAWFGPKIAPDGTPALGSFHESMFIFPEDQDWLKWPMNVTTNDVYSAIQDGSQLPNVLVDIIVRAFCFVPSTYCFVPPPSSAK